MCMRCLAKYEPCVECQCCLACECHTKLPIMRPVLVSLPPTQKHAACKRNNASMADGPEMSQCTPDFQGQLLHCIVQPHLGHGHWHWHWARQLAFSISLHLLLACSHITTESKRLRALAQQKLTSALVLCLETLACWLPQGAREHQLPARNMQWTEHMTVHGATVPNVIRAMVCSCGVSWTEPAVYI